MYVVDDVDPKGFFPLENVTVQRVEGKPKRFVIVSSLCQDGRMKAAKYLDINPSPSANASQDRKGGGAGTSQRSSWANNGLTRQPDNPKPLNPKP
jgi:hypothetical protein